QYTALAELLSGQAASADYRALRMLAHKVRGVAANLGLERLADALGALEGLVDGDSGKLFPGAEATVQDALQTLGALLETSLAEVRAALPGRHPAEPRTAQAARPGADLERAARAGK